MVMHMERDRGSHLRAEIEIWAATMLLAAISTVTRRDERSGRVGRAISSSQTSQDHFEFGFFKMHRSGVYI